jgi:hypothetical protein
MPGGSTLEVFQSAGADSLARATGLTLLEQDFESALAAIPSGYCEGVYEELRYGVTARKSRDGKRTSLFARALAGGDVGSFNLYLADSSRTSPEVREVPKADSCTCSKSMADRNGTFSSSGPSPVVRIRFA